MYFVWMKESIEYITRICKDFESSFSCYILNNNDMRSMPASATCASFFMLVDNKFPTVKKFAAVVLINNLTPQGTILDHNIVGFRL